MHQLSLSLLGSLQIMLNGQPVTGFDYDKVRALLVFLVTERDRPHPRDVVAEMLWPSQPNQVGRDSLRQALSKLRQAVADHEADPPFLLTSREILQFNPDSRFILDTRSFTDLIKASNKHHPHASPHDFESYSERGVERCNVCIPHLQQAVELYRGAFAEDLSPRDTGGVEGWCRRFRGDFQTQKPCAVYA